MDAASLHIALLGNPNCGKTALFNLLTGSRQKVANYAGVTVERKEGSFTTASSRLVRVLDLPGAYSLNAMSTDETITRDVVIGALSGEARPDLIVCVTDATNLKLNLRLVVEAKRLGVPMVLALNMSDVARHRGIHIDRAALERELGVPVVETVAVRRDGARELVEWLEKHRPQTPGAVSWHPASVEDVLSAQQEVRRVLAAAVTEPAFATHLDDRIDRVVLHPVWGMLILALALFLMFQADGCHQGSHGRLGRVAQGCRFCGALAESPGRRRDRRRR
jgi:ferrous iron transport protein B